jgi:mono/diheme cytochrome c family protein
MQTLPNQIKKPMKLALFQILMVVVLMSCSKKTPVASDPDINPPPIDTSVYAGTIQPIFNSRCVSCHNASNPQSGVNMSSYSATMASRGTQYNSLIVVAGNANGSPLHNKLLPSPQFGSQMPQGGSLTTQQITAIRDWINAGALNE